MKNLLRLFLGNYIFFLALYIFFRIVFCITYVPFSTGDFLKVIYFGLILDLSSAAYMTIIPVLLITVSPLTGLKFLRRSLFITVAVLLLVNALLFISDLELYRHWGFRMDAGVFHYISDPGEATASVPVMKLVLLIITVLVTWLGSLLLFNKIFLKKINEKEKPKLFNIPVFLFAGALLIIPLRGGFSIQPVNLGNVYFSNKPVLNHAAENVFWKMGFTLANTKADVNPYIFFDKTEKLSFTNAGTTTRKIFNTKKPNIVIVILESFSAKIISKCGGINDITPFFDKMAEKGILFTDFYANGDRTDKGIVSILSGYPSQPDNAIIKYPEKTAKLPQLAADLKKAGYYTLFFYGGDPDFASMNSYIQQGNYDKVVSLDDFPDNETRTKWGVYDHVMFSKAANDLSNVKEPFFSVCLTLSNHEPFTVPVNYRKDRKNEADDFLNSAKYTDMALAKFMNDCRKQKWYKNTVFIFVADHGHILPDYSPNYSADRFRIPLLLFGEVLLKKGIVTDHTASQADIPSILLNQIGMSSDAYYFSSDVFNPTYKDHAFYCFNNGFGIIQDNKRVIFDNNNRSVIESVNDSAATLLEFGKKMMQWSYDDFISKEFTK